jgi:hypothetical protein
MRVKLQLVICSDDGQDETIADVVTLKKDHRRIEHLGLTLQEAKRLLHTIQHRVLQRQAAMFLDASSTCKDCGTPRYRNGEASATGFVESTVNQVINQQFCKKQQMQWSKRGAHLLLQTRVKTLNHELGTVFKQWYPDMEVEELPEAA